MVYGLVYREEVWKAHIIFYDYLSIQVSLRLIEWHTYIHIIGVYRLAWLAISSMAARDYGRVMAYTISTYPVHRTTDRSGCLKHYYDQWPYLPWIIYQFRKHGPGARSTLHTTLWSYACEFYRYVSCTSSPFWMYANP